jgi:hypothetical protein
MDIDGAPLTGIVVVGDRFTIAGETGSPVHVVTEASGGGTFYVASANQINDINFTPGIASGGVPDNAAVTFESNMVVQATMWEFRSELELIDVTKFGDTWERKEFTLSRWTGRGEALLDYGDPRQAEWIDAITGADAPSSIDAVLFGVIAGKRWYGKGVVSAIDVRSEKNGIVGVTFQFSGDGALSTLWV